MNENVNENNAMRSDEKTESIIDVNLNNASGHDDTMKCLSLVNIVGNTVLDSSTDDADIILSALQSDSEPLIKAVGNVIDVSDYVLTTYELDGENIVIMNIVTKDVLYRTSSKNVIRAMSLYIRLGKIGNGKSKRFLVDLKPVSKGNMIKLVPVNE